MRIQDKPVDLIQLPDAVHIVTKPLERPASEQGDVDWFDFWLRGEENPDPAKAEQYARWRELRNQQQQNEKNSPAPSPNERPCAGPLSTSQSTACRVIPMIQRK